MSAGSAAVPDVERAIALAREGKLCVDAGRVETGTALFAEALRHWPAAPGILHNLANALLSAGRADDAIEAARRAYEAAPELDATQSNLLTLLLYSPSLSAQAVADAHLAWGRGYADAERPPARQGGRIRAGYLSSCFRRNPEYFFIEPILRHHDRRSFEVFCYSATKRSDGFTDRLRGASDHWRDLEGLSDDEAAELIREDGIDILADCSGHYSESRLRVLALRPARVQVSLPTYPATTGLAAVDFRITDQLSDPPGATERHYAEQLVRLPHVFLCYEPWPGHAEVGPLPADRNGYVTFGSFNRLDKINPAVVETWARILNQAPGARLLVNSTFHGHADPPEEHCGRILRRFGNFGVNSERIRFVGARPLREYFEVRNEVDIVLDTFPFPGLTTSCDSLWMGVPMVTLAGESHLGRSGVTLLNAVGLSDWVAGSREEYIRLAVEKAGDVGGLREIRRGLRERTRGSPLTDACGYTRTLENAYRRMLE